MSNLSGNPFAERAEKVDYRSLTPATLALAYEQRTANLIAYIETFGGGIEYETIWADISARLGLGGNNE